MKVILDYPLALFAISLVVLWLAVQIGAFIRRRQPMQQDEKDDFALVVNASLTLLALIIGFTFSMAVNRYDQRKDYEEPAGIYTSCLVEPHSSCSMVLDGVTRDLYQPAGSLWLASKGALPVYCVAFSGLRGLFPDSRN